MNVLKVIAVCSVFTGSYLCAMDNPATALDNQSEIKQLQVALALAQKKIKEQAMQIQQLGGYKSLDTNSATLTLIQRDAKGYSKVISYNDYLVDAINNDDITRVQELLDNGADPNLVWYSKSFWADACVPLFQAVETGNKDLVELLLKNGAGRSLNKQYKQDPFWGALHKKYFKIAELLIDYDADINGLRPYLHEALQEGDVLSTNFLLEHNADPYREYDERNAFDCVHTSMWDQLVCSKQELECKEGMQMILAKYYPHLDGDGKS